LLSLTLCTFLARPAIQPEALAGFAFSQVEAFKFLSFFILALSVCPGRPAVWQAAFSQPEVILLAASTTRNVVLRSRLLARSLARSLCLSVPEGSLLNPK